MKGTGALKSAPDFLPAVEGPIAIMRSKSAKLRQCEHGKQQGQHEGEGGIAATMSELYTGGLPQ